jgi:hypothetical protein
MGRTWDPESIPDTTHLPQNHYTLSIDALDEQTSKGGKLMYQGTFRVADGPEVGAPLYEYFVVGSDDDPQARDPQTWAKSIGARRMKRLFKAAGVANTPDLDAMIAAAIQQRFVCLVTEDVDDGARDPKYKGRLRNRLGNMYPLGSEPASNGPAPAVAPRTMPPISGESGTGGGITCGYCQVTVPRAQYLAHLDAQHAQAE